MLKDGRVLLGKKRIETGMCNVFVAFQSLLDKVVRQVNEMAEGSGVKLRGESECGRGIKQI